MWHPALGAVVVGVIGYYYPNTFGSGYYNIDNLLANHLAVSAIVLLGIMKFLSWTISLGSGTAGGTLAPVFTIGGTLGAVCGVACSRWFPGIGINVGMAALVGMVGIFAGASRAFLTSAVFAIETTMQPAAIIPALGGCTMAYLVSCLLMRHSIMTEKMARRGVRVPEEYQPDFLDAIRVEDMMTRKPITLRDVDTVQAIRERLETDGAGNHQGFPVVNANGALLGVVTRRDFLGKAALKKTMVELLQRPPVVIYEDLTLRDAARQMARHDIGRLPVIQRGTSQLIGILTRSDILRAHRMRAQEPTRSIRIFRGTPKGALARPQDGH
jgi:CBS domain-containing protein